MVVERFARVPEGSSMKRLSISLLVTAALGSVGLAGCAASYEEYDYSYSNQRVGTVYDDEDGYAPTTWRPAPPAYSYSAEPSVRVVRQEPRWSPPAHVSSGWARPAPSHGGGWAPPVARAPHAPPQAAWAPHPQGPRPPTAGGGGNDHPQQGHPHHRWPGQGG